VTAEGLRYASRPVPRSAAGPDLDALFLGTGGRAGLIYAATVRLFPKPASARNESFSFPDEKSALTALRRSLDDGAWLQRARLERRADRVLLDVRAVGTPESCDRDLVSVAHRVESAGGRASTHRVDEPVPAPALEREASWEAVAAAVRAGRGVWLYRLAVETVVAEGQVDGAPLSGPERAPAAPWAELLAQVDPRNTMGGAR
jgi:FAD/FMN-containing dehydrogenase